MAILLAKVNFKKIPLKPGVYFFKDGKGSVLYVGKAISLRTRLKQYFRTESLDQKTKIMVGRAKKLDFIETKSDLQAIILEAKLIKQYLPKYNILLKDGKRHLYLGITKDPYPRVKVVRRPELEELLFWAGPFPSSASLKQLLRWVRKIFPFCSCRPHRKKPCLYYQIGLCPGPGIVSVKKYRKNIDNIILFFSGKSDILLEKLKKEMLMHSKKLSFEKASEVKKQISFLEQLIFSRKGVSGTDLQTEKGLIGLKKILIEFQRVDPFYLARIEGYDIANLSDKIIVGSMVVLENGEANTSQYRRFNVHCQGQDDPAALVEIVGRRLNHQEWIYPQLILIDGGRPQLRAVVKVLKDLGFWGKIAILGLAKEEETVVIPRVGKKGQVSYKSLSLSKNSPSLKLLQRLRDESHRFAQKYFHKSQRRKLTQNR